MTSKFQTTNITPDTVRRIAELARLGLTAVEITDATKHLKNILAHFSAVQSVSATDVPMAADASGRTNVTREDIPQQNIFCTPADLLERAPATQNSHVKVKAIFSE